MQINLYLLYKIAYTKITSYSYAILPHYHTITQNNVSNVCKYAKKILPLRGFLCKNNY